tara:strand:+ start:595 stop:1284 length:690 start_codon:yes stop_codon:yes gene_type:complete
MKGKTILLYNLYPINNWKEITDRLIKKVPHDEVFIHVSLSLVQNIFYKQKIRKFLKTYNKVTLIIFSINESKIAEVKGFIKLRSVLFKKKVSVVTYIHSKGVTKPHNKNIQDWVELMRYFLIDRMDLCLDAFSKGYKLYGVNMGHYKEGEEKYGPSQFSSFHFSGNFVTVNLKLLNVEFFQTPLDEDYFGVEGFWGKLCNSKDVYCPHISGTNIKNHYLEPYPDSFYKI